MVRAALTHTSATILLTNLVPPETFALGLADSRAELSEEDFFSRLNSTLAQEFRAEPRVQIVDLNRLTALYGRSRVRDRRLYYVGKLPWQEGFLTVLADELARHVNAARGRVRKCLVVDLDNTLWGGVLGEDGPEGVLVGSGDPVAEAHFDLQRRILAIKQRGVLLAVCSKNNPSDVEELFVARQDMPLRREDFVCLEVGWDLKHQGLKRIAETLNIGTDALVFLDDNPAEIELIRQLMPEVECVLVPDDPSLRPTCLDRLYSLERITLTAEDQQKTEQYQRNAERQAVREQFSSVEEYLHGLQTRITIRAVSEDLLARTHQLFTKTNQFNVTTRRYSLAELKAASSDPTSRLLLIRVEDRFGDLGWVGAVLVRRLDEAAAHIDSFILSCRVMGRGVESAIMNHLKEWWFANPAKSAMTAEYLPTPKNVPVRDLFERHGFELATEGTGAGRRYRLERFRSAPTPCDWTSVDAEPSA